MCIITICGSMRFSEEMTDICRKLTNKGHMVFTPAIGCEIKEKKEFIKLHFMKIQKSDAIYVVDVNGYIGEGTTAEIAFAELMGKDVIYYSEEAIKEYYVYDPLLNPGL